MYLKLLFYTAAENVENLYPFPLRDKHRTMESSNPAYSCRTRAQLLKTFMSFIRHSSSEINVATYDSALKTTAPFPHIFSKNLTSKGYLDTRPRPPQYGKLENSNSLSEIMYSQTLFTALHRTKPRLTEIWTIKSFLLHSIKPNLG